MSPPSGTPGTILISDDDPFFVRILGDPLEQAGFKVVGDTRCEVVALAKEHRPEVIVLDVIQPVLGLELLAQLKRDPQTREIPVVVVSGHPDPDFKAFCLSFGAADYAAKPPDERFVMRVARLAVSRHQAPVPLRLPVPVSSI